MENKNFKTCIKCHSSALYKVSNTQVKCKKCGKKFSLKKLELDYKIIEYFCNDYNANVTSELLHVNYKTVYERYTDLRKLAFEHLEQIYSSNAHKFVEYDEYYYLPKTKRGKVKYLFDSIGILGMVYDNFVYTLILPDQFSHLKENCDINLAHLKEYSRFLNRYKIVHFQKFDNLLIRFWVFLENFTDKYKGIEKKNFIYYLKECEFRFNYEKQKREEILWDLWKKSLL